MEFTLECIGDVVTNAECAVENSREIFALVPDAREVLGRLDIEAIAGLVGRIGAVAKQQRCAVLAKVDKHKLAGARSFRETPFPACRTLAILFHDCPGGCAHDGLLNHLT